ncbi:zinc ribbon domain-containing protein, partial [Streptomyces mirabilis]|uniref:zinc ribbon domain-containing protein n=1 Tax=Streptomyces mirabilis TaxID=68239 RepID=UPI0036465C26
MSTSTRPAAPRRSNRRPSRSSTPCSRGRASCGRRSTEPLPGFYGRALVKIGRFEPTSQTCSARGVKDGPKPLHIREWTCPACGTVHDRDHNAAKNVKTAAGLAVAAYGAQVRPGLVRAQRDKAGSHGFSPEPRGGGGGRGGGLKKKNTQQLEKREKVKRVLICRC